MSAGARARLAGTGSRFDVEAWTSDRYVSLMRTAVDAKAISEMVNAFYRRVRGDSVLGPIFEAQVAGCWPSHLDTMVRFWSAALLHEPGYRGRPRAVHLKLQLEPEHFERWLHLFAETLAERFEPGAAEFIHRKARSMAGGLLGRSSHVFETPHWDATA